MEYSTKSTYDEIIGTKTKQLVLEFFRGHGDGKYSTKDISKEVEAPASSLNRALNDLEELGLLFSKPEGKFKYFSVRPEVKEYLDHLFNRLSEIRRYTLEQRKIKRGGPGGTN